MMFRTSALAALSLILPVLLQSGAALAQEGRLPTRAQQQAACEADAQRLCGQFIPDEAQVSRCMVQNSRSVSPQCRKVMEAMRKARGAGTR